MYERVKRHSPFKSWMTVKTYFHIQRFSIFLSRRRIPNYVIIGFHVCTALFNCVELHEFANWRVRLAVHKWECLVDSYDGYGQCRGRRHCVYQVNCCLRYGSCHSVPHSHSFFPSRASRSLLSVLHPSQFSHRSYNLNDDM